jgi:hypothetical protein
MTRKVSTILSKNKDKILSGWDAAISDTEQMIREARKKIRAMKRSVEAFRRQRDNGVPFPGIDLDTFESTSELMGQKGDSGQSPRHGLCLKIPNHDRILGQMFLFLGSITFRLAGKRFAQISQSPERFNGVLEVLDFLSRFNNCQFSIADSCVPSVYCRLRRV